MITTTQRLCIVLLRRTLNQQRGVQLPPIPRKEAKQRQGVRR